MKGKFSLTVLAVVFGFIANSFANTPKISLRASAEKVLTFTFDGQQGETKIKMIDNESHVIYSEEIDGLLSYSKKFDLSQLEEGKFFISVETQLKDLLYTISLTNDNVEITDSEERIKPFFRKKGKSIFLNVLNTGGEKITIKVYSGDDRVLHQESYENEFLIEKAFNFENANADIYTIAVKKGSNTYYESLVVK